MVYANRLFGQDEYAPNIFNIAVIGDVELRVVERFPDEFYLELVDECDLGLELYCNSFREACDILNEAPEFLSAEWVNQYFEEM
jgi:hypothetical protein